MKKKRKRKSSMGLLLILLGLLLIAGAGAYTFRNMQESEEAGVKAADVLMKLDVITQDRELVMAQETLPVIEQGKWEEEAVTPVVQPPAEMPEEEIDGYNYIGIIEIPSLSIQLPVMSEWDYDRLRISPCRYTGSYLQDNMIVCGHNYNRHFGPIRWIGIGADVYFISVDKTVYHYVVVNVELISGTNVEQMVGRQTSDPTTSYYSTWDLTLFTCDASAQNRYAIRCLRVHE